MKSEIKTIQRVVADYMGVTVEDLRGTSRGYHISMGRHVACHLCRLLTAASFPEIATEFDYSHHSSAMHAHDRCLRLKGFPTTGRNMIDSLLARCTIALKEGKLQPGVPPLSHGCGPAQGRALF